jgi:predicted enzyme related to lactoylglutathione lyase
MNLYVAIVEIDCADARSVAGFWAAALGTTVDVDVELRDGPFVRLAPPGPGQPALGFHQVPEPRPAGKNRVHIDLGGGAGYTAEIARLVGLGARVIEERHNPAYDFTWTVLADPEGNEFCIGDVKPK